MAFDLRDFLFHSGYPIDKVVKMMSGSITIPPFSVATDFTSYAHGLPFTPLDITMWSTTADFSTANDTGFPLYYSQGDYGLVSETLGGNLRIAPWNITSTPRTVYWRTVMLQPSNSNAEVPLTAINADIFQFNTKYNYSKLVDEGILPAGNQSVNHDLTYTPQVMLWEISGTAISRVTVNSFNSPLVTVNSVGLYTSGSNAKHYRIYGDD